jgi:hypothetical protein
MNTGRTVFSQLMDYLPSYESQKCVTRYSGDYRSRNFSCREQFFAMAFAQLTYRESLRDIEASRFDRRQTLSYGFSQSGRTFYFGRCQ